MILEQAMDYLDHQLKSSSLMEKYGIKKLNRKIYLSIHSDNQNKREQPSNIVFSKRDRQILELVIETLLEPFNILSMVCAITLVILYLFDREEKQHLLVFVFTAVLMMLKTCVEVYEEARINAFYKRNVDDYMARIFDGSKISEIQKNYIQVGDILDLRRGDIVGADAIVLSENNLKIDRSFISGYHTLLKRRVRPSNDSFDNAANVVLAGDKVITGRGKALVVKIGKNTVMWRKYSLLKFLRNDKGIVYSELCSFFYLSLVFSTLIAIVYLVAAIVSKMVFINIFSLIVSIYVSIIPEGLSSVYKLLMYSAVSKLDRRGISIRDAHAIEKLGVLSTIIADKKALVSLDCKICNYIYDGNKMIDIELSFQDKNEENLRSIEKIARICSSISSGVNNNHKKEYHKSLKLFSSIYNKYFIGYEKVLNKIKDKKIHNLLVSVIDEIDYKSVYVSGPISSVLQICNKYEKNCRISKLDKNTKNKILKLSEKMKINGCDGIAIGTTHCSKDSNEVRLKGLVFEYVLFFEEEPDINSFVTVDVLRASEIRFSILSDSNNDSNLISCEKILGLKSSIRKKEHDVDYITSSSNIITSERFKSKEKDEKIDFLLNPNFIIYGCDTETKYEIIKDLQISGQHVSYIGTNINDAKVLGLSDVGICFSDSSQICKESSSAVLRNNRIEEIIYGIEEGRLFFVNLRKSMKYITMHITPQMLALAMHTFLRSPLPISPILLIFLNYLVEIIPSKFFAYEEPETNLMLDNPLKTNPSFFGSNDLYFINIEQDHPSQQNTSVLEKITKFLFKNQLFRFINITFIDFIEGMIAGLGCLLSFYFVLYQKGFAISSMFFVASEYFLYGSPDMVLRNGKIVDFEYQLESLYMGQSSFFVGLMICQFANMLICRRETSFFFKNFFRNPKILLYSLIGATISTIIVFTGFFDEFLLVQKPSMSSLMAPSIAALIILMIDTCKKMTLKSALRISNI